MLCIYLQQPVIDTLKETNPSGRFWIKLDGTGVKEALQHFAKDKWDGDVDVIDFYKKKRSAATHILVLAVSDERKPYTIPVQYIPYKSLRDQYIRDITAPLKKTLTDAGLEVVGKYII